MPPETPEAAAKELAADPRYDGEFTRLLNGAVAARTFGEFLDMDASLEQGNASLQNAGSPA